MIIRFQAKNMKILVRMISVVGLIAYAGIVLLAMRFAGMSDSSQDSLKTSGGLYFCVVPFLYFVFSFISTLNCLKLKTILLLGVIANLALLPIVVTCFRRGGNFFVGVTVLVIITVWFGMYFEERGYET